MNIVKLMIISIFISTLPGYNFELRLCVAISFTRGNILINIIIFLLSFLFLFVLLLQFI